MSCVSRSKSPRIVPEQMVASNPLSESGSTLANLSKTGAFLMIAPKRFKDRLHVVLSHRSQAAWAKPGIRRMLRYGLVIREVDESKLPAYLRRWKGKMLDVYGPKKRLCQTRITGFALRAEVVPHFGTVNGWEGRSDGNSAGVKKSDAVVGRAIWELALGKTLQTQQGRGLWLVALVDKKRSTCKGRVLWARNAALAAPVLFTQRKAGPKPQPGLHLFHALAGWRRLQAGFRKSRKTGPWDRYQQNLPRIAQWGAPQKAATVLTASAKAGEGCGDFAGSFWGVWSKAAKAWKLRTDPRNPGEHFQPLAVVDLNGDGRPELIGAQKLVTAGPDGTWRVTLEYRVPFYDCAC